MRVGGKLEIMEQEKLMKRMQKLGLVVAAAMLSTAALAGEAMGDMKSQDSDGHRGMKMGDCMQRDDDGKDMMSEHRKHVDEMHAIAVELKQAKTDKKRIELMQRYVEMMDAGQQDMMKMMDKRMAKPEANKDDAPEASHEHEHVH